MEKKQYTILEHYVPQCYLKQFSICNHEEYFVYCLFKNDFGIKSVNIKKICAVNDLYELQIFGEYRDRNIIEDGFIKSETQYANFCQEIRNRLEQYNVIKLSQLQVEIIKNFCSLLVFRSKYMIDALIKFCHVFAEAHPLDCSKIREEIKSVGAQAIEDEIIPYMNECYTYELAYKLMKSMLDTESLSMEVRALKETLGENYFFLQDREGGFITSDVPLIDIHGQETNDFVQDNFFCLPLFSNCCIGFCNNEKYNGQIFTLSKKQVNIINQAQVSKHYGVIISQNADLISRYIPNKKALGS